MHDINEIEIRNIDLLKRLIQKLKIAYDIEELKKSFKSIYIHNDTKAGRYRILGSKIIDYSTMRTKNVQLYTLKKRHFEGLDSNQIEIIKENIKLFVKLFRELQIIEEIKKIENKLDSEKYEYYVGYDFQFLNL
jgi:hypothetical protein